MTQENTTGAKINPLDQGAQGANSTQNTPVQTSGGASFTPVDKKQDVVEQPPEGKQKAKMVSVPEDTLKNILAKQEKLETELSILRQASDKTRLSRVEELRSQGKLIKKVKVNMFMNKIIIGWKKIKDDVYMDQEGRLHEDQVVGLIFEGETEVGHELNIRAFARLITRVDAEVLEESKDRDGNNNLTIQMADGREIKIDINFVN